MQGVVRNCRLAAYLAQEPRFGRFTLVDIGCSGGIDPAWRQLGRKLRAACYDADAAEIARLAAAERNPAVRYAAGFVGVADDHPFARRKGRAPDIADNPWARLSVQRAMDLRAARAGGPAAPPAPWLAPPAPCAPTVEPGPRDPNPSVLVAPAHLESLGVGDVDFIKIDVDGKDFEILNSFDGSFDALGVLGVGVEVNFFGLDDDTCNSFHNVDRYMRAKGFELMDLSFWRYSLSALPGRFVWGAPAATDFGRIVQGDALYARDIGNPRIAAAADGWSGEKLARLALLFSMFNLPDCAAEVIGQHRARLSAALDPDAALDILAEQARGPGAAKVSYAEHMAAFERDDPAFYRGWPRKEGS